jgi:hypothetical protein
MPVEEMRMRLENVKKVVEGYSIQKVIKRKAINFDRW